MEFPIHSSQTTVKISLGKRKSDDSSPAGGDRCVSLSTVLGDQSLGVSLSEGERPVSRVPDALNSVQ